MKQSIHPQWYADAKVSCACGNTFTIGATKPEIKVEICANCHPFFTGEMRFVDAMGRVEKFQKKQKFAEQIASKIAEKKKKTQEKEVAIRSQKSLKDMLSSMR